MVTRTRLIVTLDNITRLFTRYYNQTVKSMYIHTENVNPNTIRSTGLLSYSWKPRFWRRYSLRFETMLYVTHMPLTFLCKTVSCRRDLIKRCHFFPPRTARIWCCYLWNQPLARTQTLPLLRCCVYMTFIQAAISHIAFYSRGLRYLLDLCDSHHPLAESA
jgi:hypothetical protein